ncbi:MAG: hypothetical protein SOH58_08850 [Olsenella sp.]|jgi:transcriptional regulator with XRE-family HTH domain
MAGRTPIPVARAMREVSSNLDLARRQQRITVELLAERANLSVPTVRKMLNEGAGSFENFLRIARLLGFLDGVVAATNPLNTGIGRIRAEEDVPKRVRLGKRG